MSLSDFFESRIGITIVATAVPVILGIVYVLARNYKDTRDRKSEE